jgi:alanyl-tRNA synthetase
VDTQTLASKIILFLRHNTIKLDRLLTKERNVLMHTLNAVRTAFLDYFSRNDHTVLSSSALVPHNDPTLLFTNAGMVPFKNIFTGEETPHHHRVATAQKCLRAGGKHNDLDSVGYTARHHTFFEMLGNFSFGDYFKERAILHAWTLITREFGIDPARLLVTVYGEDEEAAHLWKKIAGLPDSRIIPISTHDNFWSMGDTGPCGPCSEIFFDHGDHIPGGPPGTDQSDGDRFVEIWNLVFMQYEQTPDGQRLSLPNPAIDTGMGLERISAVLQGTHDNYATDLFRHLIAAVAHVTGVDPETSPLHMSHRVIADHLRAMAFLIAEGILPSNEGRGYVLRRIMRRAMRHGKLLGAQEPVLEKLLPTLVEDMGLAYPELVRAQMMTRHVIYDEEMRFQKTLERGLVLLEEATALPTGQSLSGDVAFTLYDTYGFPLDLTQDVIRARGISVDVAGFEAAMDSQKRRARSAWAGSGESQIDPIWFHVRDRLEPTEALATHCEICDGQVVALIRNSEEVTTLAEGESGLLIVNQTPFYAESGGQVGDTGVIEAPAGTLIVTGTRKQLGHFIVHDVQVSRGSVSVDESVTLRVDHEKRRAIRIHHSTTHLLHEALRQVLGDHITQKGSLVTADRLRFDFSHPQPLSQEEWHKVEARVNKLIVQNDEVFIRHMSLKDALKTGARALFGEKYGDDVRVVSMGLGESGTAFSIELCGGTHVHRTGDIGICVILSESAVAAGIRRIEALAGRAAQGYLLQAAHEIRAVGKSLNVGASEISSRVQTLLEEHRTLSDTVLNLKKAAALSKAQQTEEMIKDVIFFSQTLSGVPARDLKNLVDEAKAKIGTGVVVILSTESDGKAALVVGVTENCTDRLDAVALVRCGATLLGGRGGGGRRDLAQAGGPNGQKVQEALAGIRALVTQNLSQSVEPSCV